MEYEEVKQKIANKIISILKDNDINRTEFASLMNVKPSQVTKMLSGTQNFELKTIFEIEQRLGINFINYEIQTVPPMIYKPPANISKRNITKKSVFLAGSIEMGVAVDWQADLGLYFLEKGWDVFNPRRDDWDSSWIQSYENPNFFQQVSWELNALEVCTMIVMNFVPDTISPISLLELGRYATSGKMHVVCPHGYFRKGNVEVICDRDKIPLYDSLDKLKESL